MIAIVQTDPQVPAGIYGDHLVQRAIPHRFVRLYADDPPDLSAGTGAILVLGGRMGVHDEADFPFLAPLKARLRQAAAAGVPILGICLGGQLLADILGGRVTPRRRGEKGLQTVELTAAGAADPLFAGLPRQLPFFAWHNDSFDPPADTPLLASSAACPGQAFRVGNAYGLQFHPEVDTAIVAAWSAGEPGGEGILAEFRAAEARCRPHCLRLFDNFLRLAAAAQPAGRVE